jgi:transposase-like protein
MKRSNGSPRRLRKPTDAKRRIQLLAAFDRSGLSASTFARRHGIHYTTFCGWRQRQAKASPSFVQVELTTPAAPVELLIELGAQARLRITSTAQIQLAARLLHDLNAPVSC